MWGKFAIAACNFLTPLLIIQIVLGSAFAQTPAPQPITSPDPFWSNNGIKPNDPNHFWNQTLGQNNPNNDPWGGSDNSWPNDPNGNYFGDPTNDPFGVYNGFGNSNLYMNIRPTDTIWVKLIRYTGVLNKDYAGLVHDLRRKNGYQSDEAIAQEIVSTAAKDAGWSGAAISTIPFVLKQFFPGLTDPNNLGGFSVGMTISVAPEFLLQFRQQAIMIMTLAELYGELPNDEDERLKLVQTSFLISMLADGALQFGHGSVLSLLTSAANKYFPLEQTASQMLANTVPQISASGAIKVAESAGNSELSLLADALATKVIAPEAAAVAANKIVVGQDPSGNSNAMTFTSTAVHNMIPVLAACVSAAAAYGLDRYATRKIGLNAKVAFELAKNKHQAKSIFNIRNDSRAKGAVWLIVTRDVFQNSKNLDDQKLYAAILDKEMPLANNKSWDERKELFEAYSQDSKIIDGYLRELADELDTNAKLYLVKLVLAGMLMKGGLNYKDQTSLRIVATLLGLYNPPKININALKPGDIRRAERDRFIQMRAKMLQAVGINLGEKESDEILTTVGPSESRRWKSGKIILQDLYEAKPTVDLAEKVKGQHSVKPEDINSVKKIVAGDVAKIKSKQVRK